MLQQQQNICLIFKQTYEETSQIQYISLAQLYFAIIYLSTECNVIKIALDISEKKETAGFTLYNNVNENWLT